MGSIPGTGRSPGGEHGNPFQYSCLENPMGRGAWWATVHGVAQSWTWLSDLACTPVLFFNISRKLCTVFHWLHQFTFLPIVQKRTLLFTFSQTCVILFLLISILTGVRWYLIVVWFALPSWLVTLNIFLCICKVLVLSDWTELSWKHLYVFVRFWLRYSWFTM